MKEAIEQLFFGKVKAEMSCLGRFLEARREKVEAHVETKDKKIMLVIENVKVSEIKQIMEFITEMRVQAERKKTL